MKIEAHGIRAELPTGWEGRITRRTSGAARAPRAADEGQPAGPSLGEDTGPVLHMANFALPEGRGDFGSGAVDVMGTGHLLVALVEYGADSAGTALFPTVSRVPTLTARMFDPNGLQRVNPGQAGAQRFFTLNGRAFCLYSVVGDKRDAPGLAGTANGVTAGIAVAAP
ncbi:MAG TPA: hypothetical protein VEW93_04430 [Acidimicrobiales bacterium]|nr:hypothetical protein [Acidimicrobiales bacterium]